MFIINLFCFLGLLNIIHSVTYESGMGSLSASNQLKQGQIAFTKIYTSPPKVAIFSAAYDMAPSVELNFSIGNITTTKFDYCLSVWNYVGWYMFYWRATDDSKIEIINSFNTNMSGVGTKSFTFDHTNPLALYGFVVPINFGQIGDIYFSYDIVSITSTQVTVQITQNTTYLLSLGFQIILGTEPSFIQETPQTKYDMSLTSPSAIYINIPQKPGYDLYIIIKSLNNVFSGWGTRLDISNVVNNNNTISYVIRTWYYSYIKSITYQLIWINNKVFQPLLLNKLRKSRKFNLDLESVYIKIEIVELNIVYNTLFTWDIPIDKTIRALNLNIQVHCYEDLKVVGSVLQCISCNHENFSLNQVCYPGINQVNYHIKLYQWDLIDQQIKLNLAFKQLTIYQSDIYNPGSQQYKVLDLALQYV